MALRTNRALFSRIDHRMRVDPPTVEDSQAYLRMRLEVVDCTRELFADDAVAVLHAAALGAHRNLDHLATHALRLAARKEKCLVDRALVRQVCAHDAQPLESTP